MENPLRIRRTAAEWAAARQVIEIEEKLSDFGQLAAIVEADLAALESGRAPSGWRDAAVTGRVNFDFADARGTLPVVDCRVAVEVDAVCQRCLLPFKLPLLAEARLLLLGIEQTVDGYDDYEVWELQDSTVRPQDIVEELLIMAMPFAAMHSDSAACRVLTPTEGHSEEMTRPFAALREQMTQDN
ncbi:MAG: DUF177 domain-containing protein [Gammaproteobacteria bacterium]|nr:DUF177 domain-containing protein [Gammaproteobacteria bacterium]